MTYKELADILEKNIKKKLYINGKLPTEDNIINEYKATRYCVRKAINLLINNGMLYSVQGSGIFIRDNLNSVDYINISNSSGFKRKHTDKKVEYIIINLDVINIDKEIAQKMSMELNKEVYYIVRLIKVNDNFLAVEYTYYNKDIVHYLNKEIAEDSIFKYITEVLNLNIGFSDRIIYCDKIDSYNAKLLNLEENSPSLITENINHFHNGEIFNFSKIIYNYLYTKLFI